MICSGKIEKFYDVLLLFEHNIHSPLVMGPVFGSTTIDHPSYFLHFMDSFRQNILKVKLNYRKIEC